MSNKIINKLPDGYVCSLRTMTLKSVIGFGYSDLSILTVGELINLRKIRYLISMYYKLGKITFADNVLNILGITDELKIAKPGKISYAQSEEWIERAMRNYYGNKDKLKEWYRSQYDKKKIKLDRYFHTRHVTNRIYSKASLVTRNHGHTTNL